MEFCGTPLANECELESQEAKHFMQGFKAMHKTQAST